MRLTLLVTVALAGLFAFGSVQGQEKKQPPRDTSQDLAAALKFARNPFEVPETDNVEELVEFTQRVLTYEPANQEELDAYNKKAPAALRDACEKILQLEEDTKS